MSVGRLRFVASAAGVGPTEPPDAVGLVVVLAAHPPVTTSAASIVAVNVRRMSSSMSSKGALS